MAPALRARPKNEVIRELRNLLDLEDFVSTRDNDAYNAVREANLIMDCIVEIAVIVVLCRWVLAVVGFSTYVCFGELHGVTC